MAILVFMLALNFAISWANASSVGRYWTESKEVGGSFRFYIVSGYIIAIAGFTMVYSYILLLVSPIFLQIANVEEETILMIERLASDLTYLFCIATIIPAGFNILINNLQEFFEKKTLSSGIVASWNTYAQIHNTMNAARNAPSAFERIIETLFEDKNKKKDNTIIILCAILILIFAILAGYFTASAIMKKADRDYDMFFDLQKKYNAN